MHNQQEYRGYAMGAGTSLTINGSSIGGFLPTVTGTLTVTNALGTVLLLAYPVTAGVFSQIPLHTGHLAVISLTTAAGTLLVGN